jgi:hypothetical protein
LDGFTLALVKEIDIQLAEGPSFVRHAREIIVGPMWLHYSRVGAPIKALQHMRDLMSEDVSEHSRRLWLPLCDMSPQGSAMITM